jgi:RNA polymerase sigma-70 factor, ECF subfamily
MQDSAGRSVLHSEASRKKPVSDSENTHDLKGLETDERLMAAFCGGSAEAFKALFQRYRQPVFGFFCRRMVDRAQAEELTQETFLALLRAGGRYQATALFRTWLYSVALNLLRAHRRKAAFRAMFWRTSSDGHEPAAPDCIEAEVTLREAVGKLEAMDREILLLREFEELSYAEIAMLLHIPINTVRSRLFRARTSLRNVLVAPTPVPKNGGLSGAAAEVRLEEHV